MYSQAIFPENSLSQLRRELFAQRGQVLWFFGRSGSGKSAIARALDEHLLREGRKTAWLDGDSFRRGVSKDLGFSESARDENLRRAAEVAKLLVESELIVLCSFITPFKKHRELVQSILQESGKLIFINAGLETCQQRDPKGLYRQAQINTTDSSSSVEMFEAPIHGENDILCIDNEDGRSLKENVDFIINRISLGPL